MRAKGAKLFQNAEKAFVIEVTAVEAYIIIASEFHFAIDSPCYYIT